MFVVLFLLKPELELDDGQQFNWMLSQSMRALWWMLSVFLYYDRLILVRGQTSDYQIKLIKNNSCCNIIMTPILRISQVAQSWIEFQIFLAI